MTAETFDIRSGQDYLVIRFTGFVDASTVENAKPALLRRIPAGCANFVIDLLKVDFLDSNGIGLFVTLLKKAHMNAGKLYVAGAAGQPAAVLQMVGLSGALVVHCQDVAEAVALLEKKT
jgi:anti-sigma B factor antagonist